MIYSILQRYGQIATLVTRAVTAIDRKTGVKTFTEQRWTGNVGFIPYHQLPRADQVVVAEAWLVTDRVIQDKTEVHCRGKCYVVVKLAEFGSYRVAALKAAAPGSPQVAVRADHEQINELQSLLT